MAEVVAGPFLEALFDRLATPLIAEFKQIYGVEEDLQRLKKVVESIRALLKDADSQRIKGESIRQWLSNLESVAYDADDALDDFYYDGGRRAPNKDDNSDDEDEDYGEQGGVSIQQRHMRKRDKIKKALSSIPTNPKHLLFRLRLSKEIKRICDKLEDIGKRRGDFKLDPLPETDGSKSMRITSCLPSEPCVIGREAEREKMIGIILGFRDEDDDYRSLGDASSSSHVQLLPVLSIVGIAGLGKTTLAQIVYNDKRVKDNFDLMMWVCVGDRFDVAMVTEQIFEYTASPEEKTQGFRNLSIVQEKLREKLAGQRFLLVLDDVWNENRGEWHKLQASLLSGRKGSIVVVTTRNFSVAKAMGNNSLDPIRLEGLSFEDCWSLIRKSVPAPPDSPHDNQILNEICAKIVDKLTGVPLAVKTIGSFLSSSAAEGRWKNVLEMEIWDLPQSDGDILPVLKLSYEELPLHLKSCLAYCSLFPKNHAFVKSRLVKHWMAHDYLPRKRGVHPEDEGSECFNELLNRSFFVNIEGRYFMPGLYHELAQYVSSRDCLRVEDQDRNNLIQKEDCRHLSFSSGTENNVTSLTCSTNLRSLVHIDHCGSHLLTFRSEFFSSIIHLRVLDLSGSNIESVPTSVGDLKHLRFLDLSCSQIQELPQSISKLYNLFFLDVNGCWKLTRIYNDVTNLINLRHLGASEHLLSQLQGIGKLTDLQNLEQLRVSGNEGQEISQLKDMNKLRGTLHISDLQNVKSETEASLAKLERKKNLDELVLEWSHDDSESASASNGVSELEEKVLEKLQPPKDLKCLRIKGNSGHLFPSWMSSRHCVDSLESITLWNVRNWKQLPPMGNLENLAFLKMEYLLAVEALCPKFSHGTTKTRMFPSLKTLVLRHMHQLREYWSSSSSLTASEESNAFPQLQQLVVEDCPRLENIVLPKCLKSLKIEKCPGLLKNSNYNLLRTLHSLPSLSCSLEYSYQDLLSCSQDTIKHLFGLEGLEICFFHNVAQSNWSLPPSWMPYSFSQGRAADEIVLPNGAVNIHDNSDTRIFLLYAHNFPGYPDHCRDVCIRIRNLAAGDRLLHGYHLLSTCLQTNLTLLRRLSVKGCQNPESLLKEAVLFSLTRLEKLEINDCTNVVRLTWFQQGKEIIFLKTLILENCDDITRFPGLKLPNLVELIVKNCKNLTSMDLQGLLVSVRCIEIVKCPKLKDRLFMQKATNLQDLKIRSCAQLFASSGDIDEEFQNLTSLCFLEIRNCENIVELPKNLHTIISLKHFSIMHCSGIRALPDDGLPSSLEQLRIEGCPDLQERCRKTGPDWSKISSIPKRTVSCVNCYPRGCVCDYR